MTDSLSDQPIGAFLDALASSAPTPGGGSVAALTGAMAAGLVGMVCALTIGKKSYDEVQEEARGLAEQAAALRAELLGLAQADVDVFGRLSTAYKLPRTTEADAASRRAAIQLVTRQAAEVPMAVARAAVALLPLCAPAASRFNRTVASDIGVAVVLVRAAVHSAILNVEVNLATLEDQRYVREARAQLEDLTIGLDDEIAGVLEIVQERVRG
jgi:formiminotetrahydrofolate cyclodeaminase